MARNKKRFSLAWKLLIALFALILFLCAIFAYLEYKYKDRFYPGVEIAGVSVSGKKYVDVFNIYKERADLISKQGITIVFSGKKGKKEINLKPFLSGLSADNVFEYFSIGDWESILKQAYSLGRNKPFFDSMREQALSLAFKAKFNFPHVAEEGILSPVIFQNLDDFMAHAAPAYFKEEGKDIYIEPELIGEKIKGNEIVARIKEKLSNLDLENIYVSLEEDIPSVTKAKLEPLLDFARKIYSFVELDLYYGKYNWKASGSKLISWLTAGKNSEMAIDQKNLDYFISNTISPYIDSPAVNSRFEIVNGEPIETVVGKSGNMADALKLSDKIKKEILSVKDLGSQKIILSIPVDVTAGEPKITKETIGKYNIKDLVGTATTNFKGGSLDRQHNIEMGCLKLNGILIAPGEEFSAIKAIGEVSEEAGFVKEYVIKGDSTTKEVGGGLCQIATTLFRLALNAGLPITERTNHRYVISYYGPGLDATIYDPHPDLKFVNDTGSYILLQAKAKDNEVILEFYGEKDNRKIEITKPVLYNETYPLETKNIYTSELALGKKKCTEIPHKGITADVTYTVYYSNGSKRVQDFHSVYQPWQEVCLIGTGY